MKTLYTVGHSNRSSEDFFEILCTYGIDTLIDIRTIPKSRHNPWFNANRLEESCRQHGIKYIPMKELGGLRRTSTDSINGGWHNASFRGFADYMQTRAFFAGLKKLNHIIKKNSAVAIMCAEAVPWRCHRSLIADAEVIRGIVVCNIISKTSIKKHKLTAFARIKPHTRPKKLFYPAIPSETRE